MSESTGNPSVTGWTPDGTTFENRQSGPGGATIRHCTIDQVHCSPTPPTENPPITLSTQCSRGPRLGPAQNWKHAAELPEIFVL